MKKNKKTWFVVETKYLLNNPRIFTNHNYSDLKFRNEVWCWHIRLLFLVNKLQYKPVNVATHEFVLQWFLIHHLIKEDCGLYWGAFGHVYMWSLILKNIIEELTLLALQSLVKQVVIIVLWLVVMERMRKCMHCTKWPL